MERPTILEHLAALIGQTYTADDHAAVVAHLGAVEKLAQDVSALREREHKTALAAARGELSERKAERDARMWDDVPGDDAMARERGAGR